LNSLTTTGYRDALPPVAVFRAAIVSATFVPKEAGELP